VRTLNGYDANGSGNLYFTSGLWMSTSAISTLKIEGLQGSAFLSGSSFALYGVK
jgi:hypothetical protein